MIENIFKKLNKIPKWVSSVTLILACIVSAVPIILNGDAFVASFAETIKEFSTTPVQVNVEGGFIYLIAVISALIEWLIVEAGARLIYAWAMNSRYTGRGKQYYLNMVRWSFTLIKLFIGIYSIIGVYVNHDVFSYIGDALLFLVRTAVITLMYLGIKNECINDKFQFTLYSRLYMIYFVYNGALYLLDLFTTVLTAPVDVGYAIFAGIMVLVVGLSALALYFIVYKKLKVAQEEARKIVIIPPMNNNDNDSEIFKGFGM